MSARAAIDYPLLIIDASSRKTWVGLKRSSNELDHLSLNADPSKSLFPLIEQLLAQHGLETAQLASIAYCEGPGSMLGIRTAIMAIRSWEGVGIPAAKQLFAYSSLELGARIVAAKYPELLPCTLICDARRNSWNAFPVPAPRAAKIEIVATEDLPAENRSIVTFETFQRWSKIDSISRELPYEPELAFANEPLELLRPLDFASPLTLRESDFKKWTPKIHQATTE